MGLPIKVNYACRSMMIRGLFCARIIRIILGLGAVFVV
ncbi:hypothetical protein TFKS16_0587 [Tannerella forsythia KS16]|uniref:Uncharacterized protein n=1 Tax=Tannerella forsythia (strain ATCC 43037 / JCM 10827 / CCUG 21028 A / KCTC 5666 / FDC 338) TaxID=203275 RepID=G8UMF8_TANFA|nr:hypothetical protein BFO_0646 [Tannerella forsythia 92A2]BAR48194.1 hypothetical protein TF3313_0621 [Tannerella forsythia 3313]BAR50888.1 hypothetical protein TFKS16_0587 [Tannerella forsythia KS16]